MRALRQIPLDHYYNDCVVCGWLFNDKRHQHLEKCSLQVKKNGHWCWSFFSPINMIQMLTLGYQCNGVGIQNTAVGQSLSMNGTRSYICPGSSKPSKYLRRLTMMPQLYNLIQYQRVCRGVHIMNPHSQYMANDSAPETIGLKLCEASWGFISSSLACTHKRSRNQAPKPDVLLMVTQNGEGKRNSLVRSNLQGASINGTGCSGRV